jgi:hypothetical protein
MSMLEYFFESPRHFQHLHPGPHSEHIGGLAARLYRLGLTRGSGQRILCPAGKLNDYARAVRAATNEQISKSVIKRFIEEELPSHGIFKDAPIAMRHFLEHLRDQNVVPTVVACTRPDGPFGIILHTYDEHLRVVRGLALTSRTQLLRCAPQFLAWLQSRNRDRNLEGQTVSTFWN